jgi:hypothetical protein
LPGASTAGCELHLGRSTEQEDIIDIIMELADLFGGDEPPDFEKIAQLGNRYGQTFDMSWVPELTAKYNLKLLG